MALKKYHSISSSSIFSRNAKSTGYYWLSKLFALLKNCQDFVELKGTIYIDETFFSVTKSQIETVNGIKLRGISRNKICVATGVDLNGNLLLIDEQVSKPSLLSTWKAYGKHICKGGTLIHDGENSHSELIEKLSLESQVYKTEITKKLTEEENPLAPINRIHYFLKEFMKKHSGFSRENLQEWLNLYWLFYKFGEDKDGLELNKWLINRAFSERKLVRYRAFYSGKKR